MSNTLSVSLGRPGAAFARWVSDVLSPPMMALPALVLSVWGSDVPGTYRFALLYFLVAIIAPVAYVVWLVKSGRVTDFHLSQRSERVRPFAMFLVCGLAGMAAMIGLGALAAFIAPVIALLFQTLVLFVITLFWQVSIHTASAAGLVTFAVLIIGPEALPLVLLVPLIGWARVYLSRHTVAQTAAGALVGCSSFVLLFALRGFWAW